jgi:hemolysin activation/secretion protein
MLPTLGGQDIDSLVSLRGFENYRFRAPDSVFVQAEYSLPLYDPFALLLFYDAGNVGNTLGDLSFAHLLQDAGFGVNLRILRMTMLQAYLAGGPGRGLHPGFNLAKQF